MVIFTSVYFKHTVTYHFTAGAQSWSLMMRSCTVVQYGKDKMSQPYSSSLPKASPRRKACPQESFPWLTGGLALLSLQNSHQFPRVTLCSPGCFVALSLPVVLSAKARRVKAVVLGKLFCSFPGKKTPKVCLKRGMLLAWSVLSSPGLDPWGTRF